VRTSVREETERGRDREVSPERRAGLSTGSPEDRRRGGEVAGEGGDRQRQRAEAENREEELPCLGRERGKVFLKTGYGRTGQSTVPVWCTPDNAQ
jgi:hypothetical protein